MAPDRVTPDVQLRDRILELSFTVYQQGLCPHCGYPSDICRNQERFEAQVRFCHAKAAVDQANDEEQKKAGDPEWGLIHVPVYQPPPEG